MFAYIPARIGSKRIPKKNIKLLDGTPLILHVIKNLEKVSGLKGIAISTDSQEVKDIVKEFDSVTTLELRSCELADDQTTFTDLINNDLPRFSKFFNSTKVLFTTATAALVSSTYFDQGVASFSKNPDGLVMSVANYVHSPFLALEENEIGGITPLFPNRYLGPTKDLPTCFIDCGCFYIFDLKKFKGKSKLIDLSPIKPIILSNEEGIDLDTLEDWKRLEESYNKKKKKGL